MEQADDGLYAHGRADRGWRAGAQREPVPGGQRPHRRELPAQRRQVLPAAIQHVLGTLDPRDSRARPVGSGGHDQRRPADHRPVPGELAGEPGPSFELAAAAVGARLGQSAGAGFRHPLGRWLRRRQLRADDTEPGWRSFSAAFDAANDIELARQDRGRRAAGRCATEDRIARALERITAGTYTPHGPHAFGLASPGYGTTTGEPTCGPADDLGYCMERYPRPRLRPAATPDITEALRPELEQLAHRPYLGEDGEPWLDRQFGSPMTLTDHLGGRQRHPAWAMSPSSRPAATRREVAQVQRPQVFGDPDDPDAMPLAHPGQHGPRRRGAGRPGRHPDHRRPRRAARRLAARA